MSYPFTNLVFSGGGVRGCAYAKLWSVFEEYNIASQIKKVMGVSAGSVIAGIIAMGYSGKEIEEIVRSMNFEDFSDNSIGISLDIYRLITKFGWNKGDYFLEWYGKILSKRFGNPDVTLKQVYEASGIGFYTLATCLEREEGRIFSHISDPDLPFRMAVRMSISIPGFFVPITYQGSTYVDGGVVNNYPIWYFDMENDFQTIGFRLIGSPAVVKHTTSAWNWIKGKLTNERKIVNVKDYLSSLVSTMARTIEKSAIQDGYWERTIKIDTSTLASTDFSPDPELVELVINNGEVALRDYLNNFLSN